MKLTPEMIANAGEWEVRSLISRHEFPVVGDFSTLLSAQALEYRTPKDIDPTYSRHGRLGKAMESNQSRIKMSVEDMVTRLQADIELTGLGTAELDMGWLQIPSDEDKYLAVLIIRRFLSYQQEVHYTNMTKPSEIEKEDYKALKQIHNFLIEDAEDWINRKSPTPIDKVDLDNIDSILNAGVNPVGFGDLGSDHQFLKKYDVEEPAHFAGLYDSSGKW